MSFISSVCHDDVILYFINVNMVHRYIFVYYHPDSLYIYILSGECDASKHRMFNIER